jgi:hypothetical protein
MRVVIAGSHRLPKGQAPRLLIRFLAALPEDAIILMRRGMNGPAPGPFEFDVAGLCYVLHLGVEWFEPHPTDRHPGRASVFLRDIEMIRKADLVILFVTPEEVEEAYAGTMHLLDKAMDEDRPVYAYSVDRGGIIKRVGEYDPHHLFLEIAPSA